MFMDLWTKYDFFKMISKKRDVDIYGDMDKKGFYKVISRKWSNNNVILIENVIFTDLWTINDFFNMISKKLDIDIYRDMDKKLFFKIISRKWSHNTVIFLEILIYTDLWIKNDIFKTISRIVVFVTMLIFSNTLKKNYFYQNDLKKTWYLRWYG